MSTRPRERTAPEISISHTRRIPGPVQPCPSCSRMEMLVKEAYYIQKASLGWETGLTKIHFLPELIDLVDWLKLTGEGKDNEEIVLAGCGWLGQNRSSF